MDPAVTTAAVQAGASQEIAQNAICLVRLTGLTDRGARDEPPCDESSWIDGSLEFHRRYGRLAPGLVVVRPDGYVGFLGPAESCSGLITYLSLFPG